MNSEPDVSIVLPVYNEVGHIREEIKRIRAAMDTSSYSYELIVVDDGSNDGSAEVLREIEDIRLIQFGQNRGSGSARRAGTTLARGKIVVWTDADLTYPNDRIPDLVDELAGWDQVVGARKTEAGTAKMFRIPAKWFIRKLAGYLSDTRIPDLNSGFRAFRRQVGLQFLHLLPKGFSCVTTLTMTFLNNGYSLKYVPIDYVGRAGRSKFHWWRDTRLYLLQLVRMMLLYNPIRVFMPVGTIISVSALGKLLFDLFTKDFRVATNTIVWLFTGAAVVLIALIADLLVNLNRQKDLVVPATLYQSEDQ